MNRTNQQAEESIRHIKEVLKIDETNKHFTATMKSNGTKKIIIKDNG